MPKGDGIAATLTTESIIKVLDIFWVFYNYVGIGEDGKTPAMRLCLAKSKVDLEDIIYYVSPT